jgi:uncharacterized protein YjbJ (UPF0337 family)
MNDDILKGQWRQIRGNVRSTFGKLTDDDMETINGDAETLMGRIQERYGYTKEQARDAWNRFTSELGDMSNQSGSNMDRNMDRGMGNDMGGTMGGSNRDMGR